MVAVLAWLSTFYLASWGNGFNTHYGTFLRAEDSLPADMVALMDPESNPCDNFYKYGGYSVPPKNSSPCPASASWNPSCLRA
jgi:hypothetical protein